MVELDRWVGRVGEAFRRADRAPGPVPENVTLTTDAAVEATLRDMETYERFDQVLAFIHREMIVNVQANFIKESAAEWNRPWWQVGLSELLIIPEIISGINAGAAAKEFYDHVKTNGPWDHKPRLRNDLRLDETQDYHFPIRGNEKYELYYDLWSNIHFGYVGRAAGFPRDVLQAGAGNEPGAGRNDQADVISVDIGVQLWDKHGADLKPEDIHRAILDHIDDYEAAMNEDPELRFLRPWGNGR